MKNSKIIVISIVLMLTFLGIWMFVYYFNQNENANSFLEYYYYNNNKYGVKFNYPKRLLINTFNDRSVNIGDEDGQWHIIFYADSAPESLEYWMEENEGRWTKISELTLDGEQAIKLNDIGTGEGSGNEYIIVTIKGEYIFRILYRYLEDEEEISLINSFNFNN